MKDSELRWLPSKRSLAKLALPLAAIPLLISDDSNFDSEKNTFDIRIFEEANNLEIDGPPGENDRLIEVGNELSNSPIPKPPLKVEPPTASPTVTPAPTPTTEPIPTPVPTPVYVEALDTVCNLRFWIKEDIPTSIYVPMIGEINVIEKRERDIMETINGEKFPNYSVPVTNIAYAGDTRENTIHLFGHSFNVLNGEFLPFANIQNLNTGDFVILKNQNGEAFCFSVSNFALSGLLENRPDILGPFEIPTIGMQTTFMEMVAYTDQEGDSKYRKVFYLDEQTVMGKVGGDKPMDMDQYLVLMVYAEQLTTY